MCVNGAQDAAEVVSFSDEDVRRDGEGGEELVWVAGLEDAMQEAYAQAKLPSELGAPWARAGSRLDLRDYQSFSGGKF